MHAYKINNIKIDFTITGCEASLLYTVECTGVCCKYGSGYSGQLRLKFLALLSNPKFKKKLLPWNQTCVICVILIIV